MRTLIAGAGDVGRFIAERMSQRGEVIVLDRDEHALAGAEDQLDALTMLGDATHRDVLRRAEVHRADVFVAVTRDDATNLAAAALAESLGADRTIARVDAPGFYDVPSGIERKVLGADALVCASRLLGAELLRRIIETEARFVATFAGGEVQVAGVEVHDRSPLVGQPAAASRDKDGALSVGVIRNGVLEAPADVASVEVGDVFLTAGDTKRIGRATWQLNGIKPGRVILVGGGQNGRQLAADLSELEFDVRLVDNEREVCERLARDLPRVSILHGDGTQLSFLQSEHVEAAQAFVSVTRNDEINLMASLMARQLGVPNAFALAHRSGYAGVYDQLGISGTTSAHEVLSRAVDWLLPGRRIVARHRIPGTGYEAAEFRLSGLFGERGGLRARDLPVPVGSYRLGIVRGGELVRDGNESFRRGDHILILGPSESLAKFETALDRLARERRG